jgi:hypothetical protein
MEEDQDIDDHSGELDQENPTGGKIRSDKLLERLYEKALTCSGMPNVLSGTLELPNTMRLLVRNSGFRAVSDPWRIGRARRTNRRREQCRRRHV